MDFRADLGSYVLECNYSTCQEWYWNDEYGYKALRQKATGLCLVSRNGRATMKPCAAADDAALWLFDDSPGEAGTTIRNAAGNKCLARMANDLVNTTTCTEVPLSAGKSCGSLLSGYGVSSYGNGGAVVGC
ncbi:hypothetical protein ADL00_06960 [Streptomyces sp. AS58]|nr:hypothetical protein ADL00_06960 [Streptomyces sp. AS58]